MPAGSLLPIHWGEQKRIMAPFFVAFCRNFLKKSLDKREGKWYTNGVHQREVLRYHSKRGNREDKRAPWKEEATKKTSKKAKKLLKNLLTSEKESGIIYKLSRRSGTEGTESGADGNAGTAMIFEN